MLWFIFALLTAIFESGKDFLSKRGMRHVDEYVAAWAMRFFAMPFVLLLLLFIPIPQLNGDFWIALLVSGSINIVSTILFMKALKSSDLSLTIPMVSFSSLFMLVTSPILVGEFPGALGLAGILLIFFGSYYMNISERHKGILEPFGALLKESGPRLMLAVAFLWSITANIDKIGVINSSALFWVVALNIFLVVFMTPIMFFKSSNCKATIKSHIKYLIPIGALSAIGLMCQMIAISMTLVAYVISVKRTSAVIGVLAGYFLLRERSVKDRLIGAIIMLIGVVFIAFA